MKILVSYRAIPHAPGYATGDLIATGFRQLGHEVHVYGHKYQLGRDALIDDPDCVELDEVYNNNYDLLLYCEMNDPDPQYYELRNVPIKKKAYWNFDVSYYPDVISNFAISMNFDHIFYANFKFKEYFEGIAPQKTGWLPYAFCPIQHDAICPIGKEYDFSIVGSPWAQRKQIAHELQKNGINVNFITGLHQKEYIEALARSRVTINYNQEVGSGLLVMRVFECMPNRVCLITNKGDGIHRVLKPGTECFVYENIDQLIGICKMLQDDMKMAEWCAEAAFERGYKEHTYRHRAEEILRTLELS